MVGISRPGTQRGHERRRAARVAVVPAGPYAHLDVPFIGQAYLLFRARLKPPYTYSAGEGAAARVPVLLLYVDGGAHQHLDVSWALDACQLIAGPETLEVAWVKPHEVPMHQLAFSSISLTLAM